MVFFAQPTLIKVESFPNTNLASVTQFPDGEFIAFGHGYLESESDNINTYVTENGEWKQVCSAANVSWPAKHLFGLDAYMFDESNDIVLMTQEFGGYGVSGIYLTADGGVSWTVPFSN